MERLGDKPRTPTLVAACRVLAGALVLAMLAGCSSVPDAVNPVEWYKTTRDAITGKDEPSETAEAPPGADDPIPNLSTVPERPKTSSSTERQAIASGLIADQQGARRYSSDVIPRQSDLPQSAPPARPASPSAPQSSTPPPAEAPSSAAAPSPAQVQAAIPPPPAPAPRAQSSAPAASPPVASASSAPPPPVQSVEASRTPPPGAPRTPPQMREVTQANIAPGTAQPIQPADIVVPRENPQAPKLAEVKPYVPPAGLDQQETVYIGGGGSGTTVAGPARAATPANFRAVPSARSIAAEVPGTRPLSAFNASASRGSYQVAAIQFADGSSRLSDRDRAVLRGVAEEHRRVGGTLRIIGHASSRTGAHNVERHREANMKVSAERAEAVARELVRQGTRPDQMYVGAFSDADPRYFEFMPTGEAGNRRAEIFIDF